MSRGFTEAELAAALFSKQFKSGQISSIDVKANNETYTADGRNHRPSRARSRSNSRDRSRKHFDVVYTERDRRYEKMQSNDSVNVSNQYATARDSDSDQLDEFGRILMPGRAPPRAQNTDISRGNRSRSPNRRYDRDRSEGRRRISRSRSPAMSHRGPPPDPRNTFHDDRDKPHSHRSRSIRSRSQDRCSDYMSVKGTEDSDEITWLHDRHTIDEPSFVRPPPGYRPPSPTWKSRAGGVAIMKSANSNSTSGSTSKATFSFSNKG